MKRLIVILAVLGGFGSGCIGGCGQDYSNGERTGVVWKFSKKGILWKSWEGELNLGGASLGEGGVVVPNQWGFSTRDDAVAEKIQGVQRSGQRVTLVYRQWWASPWAINTNYEITEVKP